MDKTTKEPFDPALRLGFIIQERGMQPEYAISLYGCAGTIDGIRGDHVVLAPPYNVSKEEIDIIVDATTRALTDVFEHLEL